MIQKKAAANSQRLPLLPQYLTVTASPSRSDFSSKQQKVSIAVLCGKLERPIELFVAKSGRFEF